MKRFYRTVAVAAGEGGHQVLLDGRPLRTPARRPLSTPSAALAEAIAAEWRAQEETIKPAMMPLTRLASTTLDRLPDQREAAIEEVVAYAGTDLVCYRAREPLALARRQQAAWQPLLDWAAEAFGVRLAVTTDLSPVAQPEQALAQLRARVAMLDDWSLIGLHAATKVLSSLVLALALLEGRIAPAAALEASLLDELFEIEQWGWEVETERRHRALRRDLEAAALFLASLNAGPPPPQRAS